MSPQPIVVAINLISRWILFAAAVYKVYQTREKGWALLSTAFLINAIDIENYLFTPLGIHMAEDAYRVASKIPSFLISGLLLWGAVHLKHKVSELKHVVYLSIFAVVAYVWLFLLAVDAFNGNHALESLIPYLAYGGALIYFGIVILRYEIGNHGVEALFPWGLILLGALNLTYPITRYIEWFIPAGFLLGAIFRGIAAIGAVKFVFVPFPLLGAKKPIFPTVPGAFMFPTPEKAAEKIGPIKNIPNLLMVTRREVESIKANVNREAFVFWVTRVMEGEIEESPRIYAISPTKIDILTDLIAKAVESGYTVLYIDALEYLILENGFERTFKFLLNVKDRVLMKNGTMILVVDPNALDLNQRRILEREFQRG